LGRAALPRRRALSWLYLTAIRYPDRKALADALRCLVDAGISLDGASDHGVSEALYLRKMTRPRPP
jgi:catechol 2,3-dioxygenase